MQKLLLGCVFAAALGGVASAHHNMSALFDLNQRFSRTGTLTKIDWRNPHIYLTVDARNDKGELEAWSFEGPSPGFFRQRDVDKPAFERSMEKTITVDASRARDGSRTGLIRQITFTDGKTLSLCPQNC